jgi:hypothetical protein
MLMAILFASPFFASQELRGGAVMRDPDIWWHLRNAQILVATHHFIRTDFYSFTVQGQPWINTEWLAEIAYYAGFRLLGERGLFLVMFAAIELFLAGMLLRCYLRSRDIGAAFVATWIAVLLAVVNFGLRTVLFGWLCFLAEMLLLDAFRHQRDFLWLLVPLFALWVNVHGSWFIGFVFFVLFLASGLVGGTWGSIEAVRWTPNELRRLITVGAASVAALFLNPYGWRAVVYPADLMLRQRLNIAVASEWRSVSFQESAGVLVFLIVAAMLVLTLWRRRTWPLRELLFALVAIYAGLAHQRLLLLTGIVICPMLAAELSGLLFAPYDASKNNKQALNAVIMMGLVVFVVLHVPTSVKLRAAEAEHLPVKALPQLVDRCSNEHVFNQIGWGGYLIWNAREIPTFIDSRFDIFEYRGVLADYLRATNLDDSLSILDQYRIGCVLMGRDSQLTYLLQHEPGWHTQYQEGVAVLLVRDGAAENH